MGHRWYCPYCGLEMKNAVAELTVNKPGDTSGVEEEQLSAYVDCVCESCGICVTMTLDDIFHRVAKPKEV